jgi:hypothetical protein
MPPISGNMGGLDSVIHPPICADMCGSAELAESDPMLVRLETEHRHQGCAHHDTQCNRGDVPQGQTSNAQEADRDDPEPRRVACE